MQDISILQIMELFPDDDAAERWFSQEPWPDGPNCPRCGSTKVKIGAKHPSSPYRCNDCGHRISARTGTVMADSKLRLRTWVLAIWRLTTAPKGVSSFQLGRELGISQHSAWFLGHRIREAWKAGGGGDGGDGDGGGGLFQGPVEVDETYVGGRERNKHANKKLRAGRGSVGKTAVAGVRDRPTNKIVAQVVPDTTRLTMHNFIFKRADPDAMVYTDESRSYTGLPNHEAVLHCRGEYVRGEVTTNGMESSWALFKRGFHGTYHSMSPKHLDRYVSEFRARHNARELDALGRMRIVVKGMEGTSLKWKELVK